MLEPDKLVRFSIVGVITAGVHYGLLFLLVEFLDLQTTLASSVGFLVAVALNYLMHYSWTFAAPVPHGRAVFRYIVMISLGFLINGGVMQFGVLMLGFNYLLVQLVAFVAVITWNFLVSSLWVFRA